MPEFPASLPHLARTSHLDIEGAPAALRTPMDAGPAKQRRRFAGGSRVYKLGHNAYTAAQAEALLAFYEDTLGDGALAFDMAVPAGTGTASFRFMGRPPRVKAQGGGRYSVTVELERV